MIPIAPKYNNPSTWYNFHNVLTPEHFTNLNKGLEKLQYYKASINEGETQSTHRRSNIKWIPQNEEWIWLYNRFQEIISNINTQNWGFDLRSIDEAIQYTEYDSSIKGHYDWHLDIGSGHFSTRKISITLQLSDESEYEGGNLEFNLGSDNISKANKSQNTATIFPSYLLHRVSPVTKGIRKSLVLWVGGVPFR